MNQEFCHIHPGRIGVNACSICEEVICNQCENLVPQEDTLFFCDKHVGEFKNNEWTMFIKKTTDSENPENALKIYSCHQKLWKESSIATFIKTDYEVEDNIIKSIVKLYCKDQDMSLVKSFWNSL